MARQEISLSVLTITGNPGYTATLAFQALLAQTLGRRMEVVILRYGSASPEIGQTKDPNGPLVREVAMGGAEPFVTARARGVLSAAGPVAALLEDHCIPEPDWAETLLGAFADGREVVGYDFSNGSPDTLRYRSFFMAEYGLWTDPAPGQEVALLPDNNLAYHRDRLLAWCAGDEATLARLLSSPETLRQQGVRLTMQPGARVAHQSYRSTADLLRAHFHYSRLFGGTRAGQGGWGPIRRGFYAVAAPLVVPALQVARIYRHQRHSARFDARDFLHQIPRIFSLFQVAAIGELCGYLAGPGEAGRRLDHIELTGQREKKGTEKQKKGTDLFFETKNKSVPFFQSVPLFPPFFPLVSVVIPAYHSDELIGECLASLQRQTYPHIQVVVVNSSREERTRRVVARSYPGARFIQSPGRLLPQDAKNLAAAHADGELLAFIDPDCRAHPDWLATMVARCEQGRDFVGGSLDHQCRSWLESGIHLCKFHDVLGGVAAGPINIIPFSNACLTRSAWETIGPFKPGLYCSDGLLSMKARELGYTPWFEPGAVVAHIHGLDWWAFVRQRFFRGKEFAVERMAFERWSRARMAVMVLFSPLIVLQVLGRSARNSFKSGKGGLFLMTLPIQIVGQAAWIFGETLSFLRALPNGQGEPVP